MEKKEFLEFKLVHGMGVFGSLRTRVVDFLFFNSKLLNLNSRAKG